MADRVPRSPIKITLGECVLTIRPLNFRQIEDLAAVVEGFIEKQTRGEKASQIGYAREAIMVALSRDHAEIKEDDLEADMREMSDALTAILLLGGFMEGEAPAAAEANAPTSERSEAA